MLRRPALLLTVSCTLLHAAQDPRFVVSHYGPEHGLSNRHVLSLVQDRTGFMWVGTVSGLDRFDGHAYRNWSVSDGLTQGRTDLLRRDAQGRIWAISTDDKEDVISIDILDPATGQLLPLAKRHAQLPFDPATVKRIAPQRDDEVVVLGTAAPAQCIRFDGRAFIVHRLDGDRFEPLGHDRTGNVIGHLTKGTGQRIVRVSVEGDVRTAIDLAPGTKVLPLVTGRTAVGALFRCEHPDGGVRYFDTFSEIIMGGVPLSTGPVAGTDPVQRPLNITPLASRGMQVRDACIVNEAGELLFDLTRQHPEVKQRVKACWVDRAGMPWLGTEFGLFRIDIRGDHFVRLHHDEEAEGGVGTLCRGMAWQDGLLYLASEWHGGFVIDPATDSAEAIPGSPFLFGLHVSADGTVWRGGRGSVEWSRMGEPVQRVALDDNIWSLLRVDEGLVLLGGLKGLWWLDPVNRTIRKHIDPAHPEMGQAHILQLRRLTDGRIEAVGSKGLYRLTADGQVMQRLWSGAEGNDRIPYEDLHHAHTDEEGVMWLSTRGAGLHRFDPATGECQQFAMRNGFPNNMVYAAYPDSHQQLWLPTDGGIVRFDTRTGQSAVFTQADGLANDEFNRLAHAQANDGMLYFGGLNGISAFHPDRFRSTVDEARFPLVLTGVMRYSKEHGGMEDAGEGFAQGERITLDHEAGGLRISFALLSFDRPERVSYAWRLEGIDDAWNYQSEASIRLDRLPYGRHTLEVKARDANGQWTERVLQVPIEVKAPWHERKAIWLAAGVLLALTLLGVLRIFRTRGHPMRARLA